MRKFIMAATAIATLAPAIPAAAAGQYYYGNDHYQDRQYDRGDDGYYRDQRDYGRRDNYYRGQRYNNQYRNGYRGDRYQTAYGQTWRGQDGRYYCRRSDGTTGTVIGAVGGGLAGAAIGGDALGAIVGAGAGALLGRSVDRGSTNCR